MKVVILSHAYVVPENRRVCERLAEQHPDDQITVIVPAQWSTNRYGPNVEYRSRAERNGNYAVVPLRLSQGRFRRYVGLTQVLKAQHPDIFYVAQERYDWSTLLALATSKLYFPTTKTIGGSTINIDYHLKRPHHILKERLFYRLCDSIVAMNSEAAAMLRKHGYQKPTMVQHGIGADEQDWWPANHTSSRLPFKIGFVGTLSPEKGVVDLIQGAARLKGQWSLEIVGDGPHRANLKQQVANLGLQDRVEFHGYMPRNDIMGVMRGLHVLVLPSRTTPCWKEQFGLVLVEAMLSGVAVVGSDSGAIPEVIGDVGLVFPEGDIEALAGCLQGLHDDPALRRSLAEQGCQRALRLYSTSALAEQFYQFCLELLSKEVSDENSFGRP